MYDDLVLPLSMLPFSPRYDSSDARYVFSLLEKYHSIAKSGRNGDTFERARHLSTQEFASHRRLEGFSFSRAAEQGWT